MNKELVSALVVTFNAEKYIKNTILSCLNQTYKNLEVLVLDNNSNDKTVEIIKSINDNRLRLYIGEKNVGPFAGLNYLLGKAKGSYIAIQDHDDIWFPEKIDKQVEFLNSNKNIVACGTETFYYFEKYEKLYLNTKKIVTGFSDHTSLVFRNLGFRYDERSVLADQHFQKIILKEKGDTCRLHNILTIHRIRGDGKNYSTYIFKMSLKNIRDLIRINGFGLQSLTFLLNILTTKILRPSLSYRIGLKIFKKRLIEMTVDEFRSRYKNVNLS